MDDEQGFDDEEDGEWEEESFEWETIWEPALEKFLWPPNDPKPLAELLCGDEPLPPQFRMRLAELIDPGIYSNSYLVVKNTTAGSKRAQSFLQNFKTASEVAKEVRQGKNLSTAVEDVAEKLGQTGRNVWKILKPMGRIIPELRNRSRSRR